MAAGRLIQLVFIFGILCHPTKGNKITFDQTKFEIKFVGDFDVADVHHHNTTIICNIHPYFNKQNWSTNSLESLGRNLCTHLILLQFNVNDKTGQLEGEHLEAFDPWDKWIQQLNSLKERYPWLHLMIEIDDDDGIQEIIDNNSAVAGFYKSVFEILSSSKLDGVFIGVGTLDLETFEITQSFICGLSKVLRTGGFTLGLVFSEVEKSTSPVNYHSLNNCVDLYSLNTFYWSKVHTVLHNPFRIRLGGIDYGIEPDVESFRTAGFPVSKLSVQITIQSPGYTLKENNLTIPDCCGIETPATLGIRVDKKREKFLTQSDVCEAYQNDGPWFRYQTEGLDVFMTNGRSWISFDDWISLKAKIDYISQLGAGVLVHSPIDDNTSDKCGFTNVSFPLLRNINYWLSQNSSAVGRREGRMKIVVPTLPKTATGDCNYPSAFSYFVSGVILISFGVFFILAAVVFHFRQRIQNSISVVMGKTFSPSEIEQFERGIGQSVSVGADLPYDKRIEIPFQSFSIYADQVLGKGAFGVVYKALVMNRIAAVKTVKPFAEKQYIITLLSEIKIMHFLGQHENLIEFIGACTQGLGNGVVHIFTEFCPLGSLQDYLRSHKEENLKNSGANMATLSRKDLFSWCHQIANGMAFLSSKNVIHGDLSAKNILLNSEAQAKVSDFGLSRKLYSYTFYKKTKQEPLPWRWMSIEALRDLHFSTQSDVWAFGITMWEIFTLGEVPYPGISYSPSFLNQLVDEGIRPNQPKFLDDFAYQNILEQTWQENPDLRPNFAVLRHLLLTLLNNEGIEDYTVLVAKEEGLLKETTV